MTINLFNGSQHYVLKVGRRVYTLAKPWAQPDKLMREFYWWTYGSYVVSFVLSFAAVWACIFFVLS